MIRKLETQILNHKSQLDEVEEKLASGRITLDKYDARKTDLLKLIAEYQTKLDDKAGKLQAKEQELDRMTRDMERVGWIAQPFRNHQIDFDPPRILVNLRCSEWTNGLRSRTGLSPADS